MGYTSPPNIKSMWSYLYSVNGRSGASKSAYFGNEHVHNCPLSFTTTYASVINLNDGSVGDPSEIIHTF